MKSWKIIKDAWTGSLSEFIYGSLAVAVFIYTVIFIWSLQS